MNTQKLIYLLVGVVAGFVVGFAFANSVNRSEQDKLRAEVTQLRAGGPATGQSTNTNATTPSSTGSDFTSQTLTDEEIRQKISAGDANPKDIDYQRDLGRGLYLYAMNFGRADLLPDIIRMLKRVHDAEPKDDATTVLLANTYFLAGQSGDAKSFDEARLYYQKVLEQKSDDTYARTALGLTYFFDNPPDPQRAVKEYRRSLAIDPRHEMSVQSLASALLTTGELAEAEQRIEELQKLNASNPALANLRSELAQKRSAQAGEQKASTRKERD